MWFVYIILCENGSLYTGISPDPERRYQEHCEGNGAKFFRSTKPKKLAFTEPVGKRGRAQKREAQIKAMSPEQKRKLIDGN